MKRFFYSILICIFIAMQSASAIETAESMYARAYGNIYRNNTKEAIRIFEKGINSYPDCAFLYAGMGDAYLKEGNLDKAMNLYSTAQKKKYAIDAYKIDFYNANVQKNMQNIKYAIDKLIQTTKISNNPILFKNIKYLLNEKYLQTIFITEDYYNEEDVELNQTNMLKTSGKKEEALRGYLKILSVNPNNYQAANNAGVTLIELKDYKLADKYFDKAIELNPNSTIIYNNAGIANAYLRNYTKMDNYFSEALKLKSDYVPAINNQAIGRIQRDINFYKQNNVNVLLDIIKKNNENYYAMRTLAKIYFLKGDYKSAYNIILPLSSNYNFKIYTHKSFIAFKAGETQSALNYINNAISLYSDNATDYEIRGRIYTSLGRYADARGDFNKAMQKSKKNNNILYYNAANYYKEGNETETLSSLKAFINAKKGNAQSNQLSILVD